MRKIILILVLLAFPLVCFGQDATIEATPKYDKENYSDKEFKELIKEINVFFLNDYEGETQKRQAKSNDIISKLRGFISDCPKSEYRDDAVYILSMFWSYKPERYLQELRLFLEQYPKASLEIFTLDNFQMLNPFAKGIGVRNTVKTDISQTLYDLGEYEESAKELRETIDELNTMTLSEKAYRILGLNYYYLMKDYEALGKNEMLKAVCREAIEKLPNDKDKESFVKKLQELESAPK